MTALELADWIENGAPFGKYETAKQAVVMLRQQQAEIEALKERLRPCQPLCKPSVCDCLPVKQTYRETHEGFSTVIETTHPAKTLTDEEILQEAENMFGTYFFESIDDPYWIEFARAILRKAQEK